MFLLATKNLWRILAVASAVAVSVSSTNEHQPKVVLTVESHPSRRVFGSLSVPKGTPWCNGMPTYWMVGHQNVDEMPWCLVLPEGATKPDTFDDYDYSNATFAKAYKAVLDTQDELNIVDGPQNLDRHDCVAVDINYDGLVDAVCVVGANRGEGYGYNEVYLTQSGGGLVKVLRGHGLHKYPTMRNRFIVPLRDADGSQLVFIATRGSRRDDGQTNVHRMFRLTNKTAPETTPFFEEVKGNPWKRYTIASCVIVADVNNDGIDDIVMCNEDKRGFIFVQNKDSTWEIVPTRGYRATDWRNARVADVTGDGVPDLIVVGWDKESYVRVFKGSTEFPYFNFFKRPWYELVLPYATPDVEVLDTNGDGLLDLYVILVDESTTGTYCAREPFSNRDWWAQGNQPPALFVPPKDEASDLLLLGTDDPEEKFIQVYMDHSEPGCGFYLEKFGNNKTMILGQGTNGRPGHNLLLQW